MVITTTLFYIRGVIVITNHDGLIIVAVKDPEEG